jgi:hypothetical protein
MLASMPSPRRVTLIAALMLAWVCLPACSGISSLDGGDGGSSLSASEQDAVRGQVTKAVEARRWKVAWNQEIEAGADRERLEEIAVSALGDRSRHAADMLTALRERHGALSQRGRSRISAWVSKAQSEGRWARAVELELSSADDPPTFSRAWVVYQQAPPELAPDLLSSIKEERAELADDEAK